jgi:hypothetical protein
MPVSNKGWEEMSCRSRTSHDRFRRIAEHPPDGGIGGAFKQIMECGEIFEPFSLPRYLRFVPGPQIIAIAIIIADHITHRIRMPRNHRPRGGHSNHSERLALARPAPRL